MSKENVLDPERKKYLARLRQEHQEHTVRLAQGRRRRRWTEEEIEVALDYNLSAYEVALELGRTYRAVANMRSKLNAEAKSRRYWGE